MPTGWIATAEPNGPFEEHSKLRQANYSRHEWRVRVSSGGLEITDDGSRDHEEAGLVFPPHFHRTKDMIGRAMTARAGGDWLIGFDAGEFGGGLWWVSHDGKRTKPLTREKRTGIRSERQRRARVYGTCTYGLQPGSGISISLNW